MVRFAQDSAHSLKTVVERVQCSKAERKQCSASGAFPAPFWPRNPLIGPSGSRRRPGHCFIKPAALADCSAQKSSSATTAECTQAFRHMKPFRLKGFTLLAADPDVGSDRAVLAALHESSGIWLTGTNLMEFCSRFS